MNIENIFTTLLATDDLVLDNNTLEIMSKEKIASGIIKNQSLYFDMSDPRILPLLDNVNSKVDIVYKQAGFDQRLKPVVCRCWTTINNSVPTSEPHIHRNSLFSAVYYVKCSNGLERDGTLNLVSPVIPLKHMIDPDLKTTNTVFNSDMWRIYPKVGKLVIFPSWIMHYVEPHTNDNERISIAFDTQLINR